MVHNNLSKFNDNSVPIESREDSLSPAIIHSVEDGSIGEEIGFERGDKLIKINGKRPRDLIDYQFLVLDEKLKLEVQDRNNNYHSIVIEKELDDQLGLEFTEALFDDLKQCNNHCSFCFIDQQPPGQRKSLYLKDDDYRLSFLYGSYLTLTNLDEVDWQRIETQRLSPLYVSVHATDPKLRIKLLKNPKASQLIEQLLWFSKRQLQIHAQVVVCPGLNDGKQLHKTLTDLSKFAQGEWPTVISTAVVPVGLTRFRPDNDGLIPVNEICAKNVIKKVETLQEKFQKKIGSRFAWLSDEWYLIAGKTLPSISEYENLPQQENGVGSIRAFLREMEQATQNLPNKVFPKKEYSWVVGKIVEKALMQSVKRLNKVNGLNLKLFGLPSPYWGQEQVVTGLLTGNDLIIGLKNHTLGDMLLIPSIMLKPGSNIFLDDMKLEEVASSLGVRIKIVDGAEDVVQSMIS